MGHYYSIHSIDRLKNSEEIFESKYILPPMFYPLFSGEASFSDGFIVDAVEGYKNLEKFYTFLNTHKNELFKRPKEFTKHKRLILKYFKSLNSEYYAIFGDDVYTMGISQNSTTEADKATCEQLQNVNAEIARAITNNDVKAFKKIKTIDADSMMGLTIHHFLNDDNFAHGCMYIEDHILALKEEEEKAKRLEDRRKRLKAKRQQLEQTSYESVETYSDELYIATKNNKKGLADENKNSIVSYEYDTFIYEDLVIGFPNLFFAKKENSHFIFNEKGEQLWQGKVEHLYSTKDSKAIEELGFNDFSSIILVIENDKNWYYLNQKFQPYGHNTKLKDNHHHPEKNKFRENLFIGVNKQGLEGVVGWLGSTIIPFKYKSIEATITDYFIIEDNNNFGLFSDTGGELLSTIYKKITYVNHDDRGNDMFVLATKNDEQSIVVVDNSKNYFTIIKSKNEIIKAWFAVANFDRKKHTYIVITKGAKKGIYNFETKQLLLPIEYDDIIIAFYQNNTFFAFKKGVISSHSIRTLEEREIDLGLLDLVVSSTSKKSLKTSTIKALKELDITDFSSYY